MYNISSESPDDAWIQASNFVLNNGVNQGDLIEVLNGIITIKTSELKVNENFDINFRKIFGDDRIDYASSVTFVQPTIDVDGKFIYTPIKEKWNDTYFGRMVNFQGKFNQIENVISILKKGINVKRCELIIYDPIIDAKNMYKQPCLLAIDIKPRNKQITLTAFFRSQAISKSGYADYTALVNLGIFLAKSSNCILKEVVIHATSLHIRKQNKELSKTKQLLSILGETL